MPFFKSDKNNSKNQINSNAEEILNHLGIPMSTAIDMFLNQVVLVGGIPFSITLKKPPVDINAFEMSESELHKKLAKGYSDYKNGNIRDAKEAFSEFISKHQ